MFEGYTSRRLSATEDQHISRSMGTQTIEEFGAHHQIDAANPDHLDALAFQLLCNARRCRSAGFRGPARRWKAESTRVAREADDARTRLARMPNRRTHPGFFDKRPAGRPGCLDDDLFLPFALTLHLGRETLAHALYEPELRDGAVYRVRGGRDLKTWLKSVDGGRAFPVANRILRGLMAMGRIEALPLSAAALPRAA